LIHLRKTGHRIRPFITVSTRSPNLLRGELISLKICGQLALPIHNHGMQGMGHEAFVRPGIYPKHAAHLLYIRDRSGEEAPGSGIRLPGLGGGSQNFGLIVRRVPPRIPHSWPAP
jgi:hypothetical protein